jgi:hypothetical protein
MADSSADAGHRCPMMASGNDHGQHAAAPDHGEHATAPAAPLAEPGQAMFGALREVLDRLEADPATDWSRVDLDALREHLLQMDLVFRGARVAREPLPDGMRYLVRGSAEVLAAASAMGSMHAEAIRSEAPTWRVTVAPGADAVALEVRSDDPREQAKIRALGFAGFFTFGSHHADHHWAIASGAHAAHH